MAKSKPRPFYAEFHDYAGMRDALRQRVEQLNVSRSCLDNVAGLASGYAGKILAPYSSKKIGGMSLGLLVQAAGLKMALVDNPDPPNRASVENLDALLKAAGLRMVLISDPAIAAKAERLYERRDAQNVRLNNDSRKNKGRQSLKLRAPTPACSKDSAAAA
jgi:hypothetical protein